LQPGDLIQTIDDGCQPLRLNLSREVSPADLAAAVQLHPIHIPKGSLGAGLPRADLKVSRQHRMLVRSKVAERMFGAPEVLVAAIRLVGHHGIKIDHELPSVTYHHLVFDQHQIVYGEGAPSESFHPGDLAMGSLSEPARREFLELFPDIASNHVCWAFARHVPARLKQKRLVSRIHANEKPVLDNSIWYTPDDRDALAARRRASLSDRKRQL